MYTITLSHTLCKPRLFLAFLWVSISLLSFLSQTFALPEAQGQSSSSQTALTTLIKSKEPLSVLAFGSCNRSDLPQPYWKAVLKNKPQLWVWLGDVIYGDSRQASVLQTKYSEQRRNSDYKKLLASVPVVGVWDDHDYGEDDSGIEFPIKEESKELFLDFVDEPKSSLRRTRQGIYTSYDFGPDGRNVRLVLLDGRSFREKPGINADPLGEEQWSWLQRELSRTPPPQLIVLGSSYQILAQGYKIEDWSKYPYARERLLKLLGDAATKNVVLISGDTHFAELSLVASPAFPKGLFELTSSGLTHSLSEPLNAQNTRRVGTPYHGNNFGILRFEWKQNVVNVGFEIQDSEGKTVLRKMRSFDIVQPTGTQ